METVKPPWIVNEQPQRKSTADKRYKTEWWKQYSVAFRIANPECIECKRKGISTPPDLTDHVIRVNDGGSFEDQRNHQAMCRPCHKIKSDKERNGLTLPYELNERGDKIPYKLSLIHI